PSITVKAIDSTGAGDIFHGAFTYGIAKGTDYEKMLKISNIAGAVSVTRIGGRNSVFSPSEMKEVYNEFE
ncbi:MAG: PfkB family carbohydrate kinase, partial [Bacilli bacterium]|nr:PfkB family carbohydrate kinase [Bacilli bacterium]